MWAAQWLKGNLEMSGWKKKELRLHQSHKGFVDRNEDSVEHCRKKIMAIPWTSWADITIARCYFHRAIILIVAYMIIRIWWPNIWKLLCGGIWKHWSWQMNNLHEARRKSYSTWLGSPLRFKLLSLIPWSLF